jgi:hypothetical protein
MPQFAVEQHAEREAAVETRTAVLTEDPLAAAVSTATHPLELLALAEKHHHLLRGSSALTVLDRLSKVAAPALCQSPPHLNGCVFGAERAASSMPRPYSSLLLCPACLQLLLLAGNGHAGKALREEALSSQAMQLLLGV